MKYDLALEKDAKEAREYMAALFLRNCMVEIKKISPRRSIAQNAYLHLIIAYFGVHFGWTLEEAKIEYKRINQDIYAYERNEKWFMKSSKDLTVEEMAKSIDKFRQVSAERDFPLPLATQTEWLKQIENEIERSQFYL